MPWTKEDRSFKTLINKRTTDSTNKAWYNEFSDSTINVHGDELWVDSINSSPTQAVSDGVAELHTLFTLTLDGTVPNQQSYYAYDTIRLKDWISTKYGDDYQVHLFDNNNTEIFPTDVCQWFFDYQTGILTFNGSTAAFSKPFKITAYRYIGAKGISGAGTSGTSGTSGINGTSGTSGINGNDGTSGTSGIDGTSGTSGIDGTSGTSGIDGTNGTSGTSGIDGTSGTSGIDGTSGTSGIDGTSGTSGIDGTSGTSGIDGTSGTSGIDGTSGSSGTSGIDGTSGTSGIDGTSGSSGTSGIDGTSGTSGTSGIDGTSGTSGIDGTSGTSGIDGTSGTSGIDGTSGTSGIDGTSGTSGIDGTPGTSGTSGNSYYSAGCVSQPAFVDNGDGSFTVASGTYNLYHDATGAGSIYSHTVAGDTFTPTSGVTTYLVCNYNSGTPVVQTTTDVSIINETTIIPIYTVFRMGTSLDYLSWDNIAHALSNKLNQRFVKTNRFERESGFVISELATRRIDITGGTVWYGSVKSTYEEFISDDSNCTLREWVYNGTTWSPTVVTQYDNTNYQGTTGKTALTNNHYGVIWVYKKIASNDPLGNVAGYVLGTDSYAKLADAQAAEVPSNLPPIFLTFGMLVGRIIVQKSASAATQVDSVFTLPMTYASVTDHENLSGLQGGSAGEHYHVTQEIYDNLVATGGTSGTSGTSGVDGTSGTSGIDGTSGSSGTSGDGTSGTSGIDGTSGTSGLDGTSGTSGANGSPGTSGTSGTSGTAGSFSGDASDITIGELPSGESWDDGLLPFSEGDSVQSTIYDINTILTLIAPAKPGLLTSQALTLSGTTKYSAKLPSGLGTAWYGDGAEAGDTITDYVIDNIFRVTSPDSTTRFYVGLVDNPQGVLNLVRDGSTLDSYDVSLGAGSSTMLTVSDVSTYNSVWTKANAYADITQSDEGYRGYTFSHPLAGTTSTTAVRYDNVASTPSFSSTLSIAENSKVSKYLSGIEYYGQNSTFNISYTAASGIFQKCYHPTAVATVSQNVAAFASFNQNPASTPAYNDTFAVSSYTVTMSVANKSSNSPSITVTLNKPDGKTATSTANLTKGLCTYGTVSTTTADSFYDEAQRLVLDTDTAWTSSSALTTGNAQVRNGTLQYPNSTEYPGFSGNQEYQRKITKASASTGTITLTGLTYSNISPYGTGSINVLFQLDTDGVFFDLGRVVGDNNGDGSGDSRANSKGARVSGSGYVVSWSLGTYSTADNNSQYRVIIIFRNTTYSITAIASA